MLAPNATDIAAGGHGLNYSLEECVGKLDDNVSLLGNLHEDSSASIATLRYVKLAKPVSPFTSSR